jgi:hypothetical protein
MGQSSHCEISRIGLEVFVTLDDKCRYSCGEQTGLGRTMNSRFSVESSSTHKDEGTFHVIFPSLHHLQIIALSFANINRPDDIGGIIKSCSQVNCDNPRDKEEMAPVVLSCS